MFAFLGLFYVAGKFRKKTCEEGDDTNSGNSVFYISIMLSRVEISHIVELMCLNLSGL